MQNTVYKNSLYTSSAIRITPIHIAAFLFDIVALNADIRRLRNLMKFIRHADIGVQMNVKKLSFYNNLSDRQLTHKQQIFFLVSICNMQFPLYPRPWTCLKEFLLFYMWQLWVLHIVILFIITTVGSTYRNYIYTAKKHTIIKTQTFSKTYKF